MLAATLMAACGNEVRSPEVPVAPAPSAADDSTGTGGVADGSAGTGGATPAPRPRAISRRPSKGKAHRCALDAPWLHRLGLAPERSLVMHFDRLKARGGFGAGKPATFAGFGRIERTAEEHYTFPPAQRLRPPDRAVVVLRGVSSPVPKNYKRQASLPGGVVEYRQVNDQTGVFARIAEPTGLWTFPDRSWVRVIGTERVAAFTKLVRSRSSAWPGSPPPPPSADDDVAWELCGDIDPNEVHLPFDRWPLHDHRTAVRLRVSRPEVELAYPFSSVGAAKRAVRAQRQTCTGGCGWLKKARTVGTTARFDVSARVVPTARHATRLQIANRTRLLRSVPSTAPGKPPSGFYQVFTKVLSDTCPTKATGKKDRGWHHLVEIRHEKGRAVTDLTSMAPRKGIGFDNSTIEGVELTVGRATKERWGHLCPNYAIENTMTVKEVSANVIRVRSERNHIGSTAGCRHPNLPSNCASVVETTWVLRRPACPAACDASYDGYYTGEAHGEPPNHVHVTCRCP